MVADHQSISADPKWNAQLSGGVALLRRRGGPGTPATDGGSVARASGRQHPPLRHSVSAPARVAGSSS